MISNYVIFMTIYIIWTALYVYIFYYILKYMNQLQIQNLA